MTWWVIASIWALLLLGAILYSLERIAKGLEKLTTNAVDVNLIAKLTPEDVAQVAAQVEGMVLERIRRTSGRTNLQ